MRSYKHRDQGSKPLWGKILGLLGTSLKPLGSLECQLVGLLELLQGLWGACLGLLWHLGDQQEPSPLLSCHPVACWMHHCPLTEGIPLVIPPKYLGENVILQCCFCIAAALMGRSWAISSASLCLSWVILGISRTSAGFFLAFPGEFGEAWVHVGG